MHSGVCGMFKYQNTLLCVICKELNNIKILEVFRFNSQMCIVSLETGSCGENIHKVISL